jgi:DNA-binding response OmpR family regulator
MGSGTIVFYNPANGKPSLTRDCFKRGGYEIFNTSNCAETLQIIEQELPKAALIFIDHCGESGFVLCQTIRKNPLLNKVALVMISKYGTEEEIIRAFESGADDYIAHPHGPRELLIRLNALIRRLRGTDASMLRVKDIEIDLETHQVVKSGRPVELTYIQFKLLYLLASKRDSVFSRQEILDKVWGKEVYVTSRTVDVHIKRLREKLGEFKYPSRYIETVHGTGYRLMQ